MQYSMTVAASVNIGFEMAACTWRCNVNKTYILLGKSLNLKSGKDIVDKVRNRIEQSLIRLHHYLLKLSNSFF